jgi:hypothetical protein
MADQQIKINLYQTIPLVRETLPVGVKDDIYINTSGNSLLATVFVKSGPGSVVVEWYDYGASNNDDLLARKSLAIHPTVDAVTYPTDRRVVSQIHNNLRLKITVSGGPAEVYVVGTVVSDFPMNAGVLDGQLANLASDGGMPIMVYDETQGKFFFLRGVDGFIGTDPEGPGEGKILEETEDVSPGPEVELLNEVVPALKTWRLRYAEVACRGYGRWRMLVDGTRVAGGIVGLREKDRTDFPSGTKALAGQTVQIMFTYSYGPAGIPVDSFIGVTEI